jgi:hypothetical protein
MINESKLLKQHKPDYREEVIDIKALRQSFSYTEKVPLGTYIKYFDTDSIFIPESQRGNVWNRRSKTEYITALLKRDATDDIVLNDIAEAVRNEPEGEHYYKDRHSDGFSYELVDGSNRSSAILSFFRGEVRLGEDSPALDLGNDFIYKTKVRLGLRS